jgi:DnaJ-class molecular chaperone
MVTETIGKIKLEEWEEVCPKCKGSKSFGYHEPEKNGKSFPKLCPKCKGSGKFDFIEKIVGKKKWIWDDET